MNCSLQSGWILEVSLQVRHRNVGQFLLKDLHEGILSPHPNIGAKSDFYLVYCIGTACRFDQKFSHFFILSQWFMDLASYARRSGISQQQLWPARFQISEVLAKK
ncbi:hypothetical protein AVEN_188672-1 [Araneus ventricosus]|uniref:Uncharacterized protein n=1 Tax=Araneus ventricosus TaxID=182803 RepID=A0A4Y2D8C2_ARAVE|nr:hypothetical protein AVEN_188672-1 [Araneus ventricosus]